MKVILIIGSLEWIRTLFYHIEQRKVAEEPYFRLVIIIGAVSLFTAISVLSFKNKKVKDRFNI